MTKKTLRPLPGRTIPMPDGNRNLNPEGEEVIMDGYWWRVLQENDVEEVAAEVAEPSEKPKK